MATIENPIEKLAPIVSQLYELAGNSQVPKDQQQALLIKAHDLRGDLVTLVAMQFTQSSAAYQQVMANLDTVTGALDEAEEDIAKAIAVISGAADLAKSIDDLLKTAVQTGATAAKFV